MRDACFIKYELRNLNLKHLMDYRQLGKTNLTVSAIGFGSRPIDGVSYGETNDRWSKVAISRAFGAGGTFIDTADRFGNGLSETLVGAITNCRADIIIATKGGYNFYDNPSAPQHNFSAEYLRHAANESRRRLKEDILDIYLLDEPPADVLHNGTVFDVLDTLKTDNIIRFGGVSANSLDAAQAAIDSGRIDVLEITFNLLAQDSARMAVLDAARRANIGVIVKEPLANGALTGKYRGDENFPVGDIRRTMDDFSTRVIAARQFDFLAQPNRTPAQAAIQFAMSHPAVSVVVPGCKTHQQATENFAAANCPPLSADELARIHQLSTE